MSPTPSPPSTRSGSSTATLPENVFLTKDGGAGVLDFGLTRHQTSFRDRRLLSLTPATPSEAGTVVGTVAYLSPWQARGLPVDHRSDQFFFSVVLYEMLAGRRPFRGATAAGVFAVIIRDEPEPLSHAPPPSLAPSARSSSAASPRNPTGNTTRRAIWRG